jgi:6-phosphogluconolactonase
VDSSNRRVYVPTLGSDAIFVFDYRSFYRKLTSATPAVFPHQGRHRPRHFELSADGKYMYVLSEFTGDVTTLAVDGKTGLLSEAGSAKALPSDTKLVGRHCARIDPGTQSRQRHLGADVHMTPNGKFMYASERTSSSIGAFAVDAATGKLTYLSSTPTEKQPRGFAIDPTGKFLVATGEKSENVSVYAIDGATGALKPVAKAPVGKGANWVEIVRFD